MPTRFAQAVTWESRLGRGLAVAIVPTPLLCTTLMSAVGTATLVFAFSLLKGTILVQLMQ